jgi:hypothetical protein
MLAALAADATLAQIMAHVTTRLRACHMRVDAAAHARAAEHLHVASRGRRPWAATAAPVPAQIPTPASTPAAVPVSASALASAPAAALATVCAHKAAPAVLRVCARFYRCRCSFASSSRFSSSSCSSPSPSPSPSPRCSSSSSCSFGLRRRRSSGGCFCAGPGAHSCVSLVYSHCR